MPLVGASLWAAERIKNNGNDFAFPKYCTKAKCNSNSASAALNKWLKPRVPDGCVVHSFRHSLRDRLREVECPSDVVDAIGGWSTAGALLSYLDPFFTSSLQGVYRNLCSLPLNPLPKSI